MKMVDIPEMETRGDLWWPGGICLILLSRELSVEMVNEWIEIPAEVFGFPRKVGL